MKRAFGVLVVVCGLLAAPGTAPPALADHGPSTTVVQVANTAGLFIDQSTYGQTIRLYATVSDSSFSCLSVLNDCDPPSGTVTFYYGNDIPIGSAGHDFITRRDSQFVLDYCCLPAGTHTITAIYNAQADGGGNHFSPSVDTITHTVQKASPDVLLHQSSSNTTLGQSVTFTATVVPVSAAAATPTGTVQFFDNGVALGGPVAVSNTGTAVLTTSALGPGSRTITAQYSGDANHLSVSETVDHTVRDPRTSVSLTSSPNPSTVGQSVLLQAVVSGADGVTPTGTVTFKDGGTTLGTVALSGGVAQLSTSALAVGSHTLTAVYNGDATHTGSTSNSLTHTVNRHASTTALTSNPNPSLPDQPVTFTATVTTTGTPTGTVTFKDGATTIGTAPVVNGVATFTTSSLAVGPHSITATYSGDATHAPSTSNTLTQTVNRHASTTGLTSNVNPSVPGQPVTLTATVSTSGTPTGTVTFKDGATTIGTAPVVNGVATFTTSSLAVGTHSITATYSGDATHAPSTSNTLTQTVNRHPSTTGLTSNVNPSVPGQPVTLTATVSTSGTPTGTVTFKDGATTIGTAPVVNGVATFTTSSLAVGTHSITAVYGGDATHAPSTSPALSQTVRACTITAPSGGGNTVGTAGNDVICGSAGADDIAGLGGDDLIVGLGGNDRLMGGDGNDTLWGGEGDDQLAGAAGGDRLMGDAGTDAADGGDGSDACVAEAVARCEGAT